MAKGNTWMKQKMAKLKAQRRRDPMDLSHLRSIKSANHAIVKRAADEAIARFDGLVTVGGVGPRVEPEGKGKRRFDASTGGNFKRREHTSHDYFSLWSTTDELIKAR